MFCISFFRRPFARAAVGIGITWCLEAVCAAAVYVFMPEGAVSVTLILKPRRRVAK